MRHTSEGEWKKAQAAHASSTPSSVKDLELHCDWIRKDKEGFPILGPWIVLNAALEVAKIHRTTLLKHLEEWSEKNGKVRPTLRFMDKAEGALPDHFRAPAIAFINKTVSAAVTPTNGVMYCKVPEDLFELEFYTVEACKRRLVEDCSLPAPPKFTGPWPAALIELADGDELEVGSVQASIERLRGALQGFAVSDQRLLILSGGPGDGKTTAIRELFIHLMTRPNETGAQQFLIYVPVKRLNSYAAIVDRMLLGLDLRGDGIPGPDLGARILKIETFLKDAADPRQVLIAIDDCDYFDGGIETTLRDQSIGNLLEFLLDPRSPKCKLIVGLSASADDRAEKFTKRLTDLVSEQSTISHKMPRIHLGDGDRFIAKNGGSNAEDAQTRFRRFVKKFSVHSLETPTLVTSVLATAFCLSPNLGSDDEPTAHERRALSVALSHDIQRAVDFLVDVSERHFGLVLRVVALHEEGCNYEALLSHVRHALADSSAIGLADHIERDLRGLRKNLLAPVLSLHRSQTGGVEYFDVHTSIRRAVIRHWQRRSAELDAFRQMNRRIASLKLAEIRSTKAADFVSISEIRKEMGYYVHGMASLDDRKLAIELMPTPNDAASLEVVADGKDLTESERFAHLIRFLCERIDAHHKLSRSYAADGLRRELLERAFFPGYYLPPGQSPLSGSPPSVPAHFPFRLLYAKEQVEAQVGSDRAVASLMAMDALCLEVSERLANAALRIGAASLFTTANTLGERLSAKLHNADMWFHFRDNRLKWRMRRGALVAGDEAAQTIADEYWRGFGASREVRRNAEDVVRYAKVAGRFADFRALQGFVVIAAQQYNRVYSMTRGHPLDVFNVPSVGDKRDEARNRRILHERPIAADWRNSRNRVFVTFALRTLRLHAGYRMNRLLPLATFAENADRERAESDIALNFRIPEALRLTHDELEELERNVVAHFKRLADLDDGDAQVTDEVASVRIDLGAYARFKLWEAGDSKDIWFDAAQKHLDRARLALLSGSIGPVTRVRLQLEQVRLYWNWFLYGRTKRFGASSELGSQLISLDRLISGCREAQLLLFEVDSLLLRAEIVRFSVALKQKCDAPLFERRESALKEAFPLNKADKLQKLAASDIEAAMAIINRTRYGMRRGEAVLLDKNVGAVPCAYVAV